MRRWFSSNYLVPLYAPQYTILCGHPPFYAQSRSTEEIMEQIKAGRFSLLGDEWEGVSSAAKNVIEGIKVVITCAMHAMYT